MNRARPDRPRGEDDQDDRLRPEDDKGAAVVRERGEGAHEEQITDEANLRDDPSAPNT